jgi:cytochrome oxidase assembly protein ShyY1
MLVATRPDVKLWSARALDSVEAARHVPAPFAPWSVVVLGNKDVPWRHGLFALENPFGDMGERVHLSYAIQWFVFAIVTLAGSIALLVRASRRDRAGRNG